MRGGGAGGQHTEAKLPWTDSASRPPGTGDASGLGKGRWESGERVNLILVCRGHVGSFPGGAIGRAEVGLICTGWEGRVFQKGAQVGQRPGRGICELLE